MVMPLSRTTPSTWVSPSDFEIILNKGDYPEVHPQMRPEANSGLRILKLNQAF
jgi:hypothetical protein